MSFSNAPSLITGVNRNHRLARGLTAAFTFETGQPYEWIRHGFGGTNGTTAPTRLVSKAGRGIHYTTGQQAHRFATEDIKLGPPEYTHVFVFAATSFPSYGVVFSLSNGNTSPGTTNFGQNNGGPSMSVWHDSSVETFGTNTDWTDGNIHVGVISSGHATNSLRIHRDGVLYHSATLKRAGTFPASTFNFAQDRFHTGADMTGDYYLHLVYDRQLPDAAIKELSADPWAVFRHSGVPVGIVASGATASLTGVAASAAIGTLGLQADSTIGLTGVAATAAVGDLVASGGATASLVGVTATPNAGVLTITASGTLTLTGVSASAAVGTLQGIAGQVIELVGVSASAQAGTLSEAHTATLTLTGVSATSIAGILATEGGIGAVEWTVVSPDTDSWSASVDDSSTWTVVTDKTTTWE